MISLIERMPMTKWSGSSNGIVTFTDKQFGFEINVPTEMEDILYQWIVEICDYRLHRYFERKAQNINK